MKLLNLLFIFSVLILLASLPSVFAEAQNIELKCPSGVVSVKIDNESVNIECLATKTENETEIKSTQSNTLSTQTENIEDTTEVLVKSASKSIEQDSSDIYEIVVVNQDKTAKAYSIEVSDIEGWATSKVDPSNFELEADSSQKVNVYVTANEAAALGKHSFAVSVKSDDTASKQINLEANLTAVRVNPLLIIVIILAIILVVLVLVFLKTRDIGDEETLEGIEETYY